MVAITPRTPVATITAVATITPITAVTRAAAPEAAAIAEAVVTVAPLVALLHHDRGTILMRLDAHRHEADHVFAETHLTLHLAHRRMRRIDIEQGGMGFAVFADL